MSINTEDVLSCSSNLSQNNKLSCSLGDKSVQSCSTTDFGYTLSSWRKRISHKHRCSKPRLSRSYHHCMGLPKCCKNFQSDFSCKINNLFSGSLYIFFHGCQSFRTKAKLSFFSYHCMNHNYPVSCRVFIFIL